MSDKSQRAQPMADQPPNTTILITNDNPGQTMISLPQSGNLWVAYEFQLNPAQVFIWHQGGGSTTVPPGFNTFPVSAGDALTYALANPSDSIKLGWAYV
jgi:hypothetical protein